MIKTRALPVVLLLALTFFLRLGAEQPGIYAEQKDESRFKQAAEWSKKADGFYKEKKIEKVIECLSQAVGLNPENIEYVINLGRMYIRTKNFADAEILLKTALKNFPLEEKKKLIETELADTHYYWAGDLKKKSKYTDAIKHYEIAYGIVRTSSPQKTSIVMENIGALYSYIGDLQKAEIYYLKALELNRSLGRKKDEGLFLHRLGKVFFKRGEIEKSMKYYKTAIELSKESGGMGVVADSLSDLGRVYQKRGETENALSCLEESLAIRRELGEKAEIAKALNGIGLFYSEIGQNQTALHYLEQAVAIWEELGNPTRSGSTFNNISKVYYQLSLYQKSLQFMEKALNISGISGNQSQEAFALANTSSIYIQLGQHGKARENLEKALVIRRKLGEQGNEATTLMNIGLLYYDAGQYYKALEFYEKALPVLHRLKEKDLEATTLHNMGGAYAELEKYEMSLKYYEKALTLKKFVGDMQGLAETMNNIGRVYFKMGNRQKALEYYYNALPVLWRVGYQERTARILNNLMFYWKDSENIGLSVFFGKLSIDFFQKVRKNISGLLLKNQKSYAEARKYIYHELTDMLIAPGRLGEAQQVLGMLKESELYDFTLKSRGFASMSFIPVDFTLFERKWVKGFREIMDGLTSLGEKHQLLKLKSNKSEDEKNQLLRLEKKLKKKTAEYEDFLVRLKKAFDQYDSQSQIEMLEDGQSKFNKSELMDSLVRLDKTKKGKHAVIHFMVYNNLITAIITLASDRILKQIKIDQEELNRMIMTYRYLMMRAGRGLIPNKKSSRIQSKRNKKLKKFEKQFYKFIFQPVDKELQRRSVTNLAISLDGVLRYLPLGGVWDGNHYMLQKYRISIITPASLIGLRKTAPLLNKILALGASKGNKEFSPLPNVPAEIRALVEDENKGYYGLIRGTALLDQTFTRQAMIDQIKTGGYPIVHIASHFQFSPGDESRNHLLLGDGTTMTLSDIRAEADGKLFDGVSLMVLSACQTGVGGNGEEIDGFGELAQRSGAKSVVASLWPVADESTKYLMVSFYQNLKQRKLSKIEALRRAQLELSGLEDLLATGKTAVHNGKQKRTKYAHPYYWAPFIMMGDWR